VNAASPAQYVSFYLAGETCAVGIQRAREIVEYDTITPVPLTPPWILGVMNLRGRVVPVIDLTLKFGLPSAELTRWTCVLIVEVEFDGEATQVGVLVEAVGEVVELEPEDIVATPPSGTLICGEFLAGVGTVGDKSVLLLDLDRVLSLDELLSRFAGEGAGASMRLGEA